MGPIQKGSRGDRWVYLKVTHGKPAHISLFTPFETSKYTWNIFCVGLNRIVKSTEFPNFDL